ncbi:DUF1343 domain-containing protein [Lactobacillus rizhaonensis]|uniref:DUF1343 domain-containing protein n=1 Tax=Lactobacillus rizhaonensis TaxID=3082863 RepID=UPI0030C75BBE
MKLGIENINEFKPLIINKNIGLITNFTGLTSDFNSTIDVLNKYSSVKKVFTLEHGLHGIADPGQKVANYFDQTLKITIHSLYGSQLAPTADELKDIDILIFDVQDIGVRYFTYISNMFKLMQVANKLNLPFLVMDRPLLLGRKKPLGQIIKPDFYSFVGMLPLPNYYGLTIGELASWIKATQLPNLNLFVSHLIGWKPELNIEENGLPFVAPSPNLPSMDALRLYPGLCLLEGTNISEGRGTVKPFEQLGAPWINEKEFTKTLRDSFQNSGVLFQTVWFKPSSSKFCNKICKGVQIHIVNHSFNPLIVAIKIIRVLLVLYPNKFKMDLVSPAIGTKHNFIEYLMGCEFRNLDDTDRLLAIFEKDDEPFYKIARNYYFY